MTQPRTVGQEFRWTAIACAVALAVAPMDWPYGYYQFMRLAVTGVSIWMALIASRQGNGGWSILGWALALLFNPLIPIHLDRETWMPIDWIAAVLLGLTAFKLTPRTTT